MVKENEDINKMGTFIKRTDELKSYNDKFQKRIFVLTAFYVIFLFSAIR